MGKKIKLGQLTEAAKGKVKEKPWMDYADAKKLQEYKDNFNYTGGVHNIAAEKFPDTEINKVELFEEIAPGKHVIIFYENEWYKIPWIVIEDEALDDDWKLPREIESPLQIFVETCSRRDPKLIGTELLSHFREIYLPIMPRMVAYKLYNV